MSREADQQGTGPSQGLRDPSKPGERDRSGDRREPGRMRRLGPRFWWTWMLMFLLLWLWQDFASGMGITTIPYSAFKQHLERGQVIACEVQQDEVIGRIDPTREPDAEPDAPPAPVGAAPTDGATAQADAAADPQADSDQAAEPAADDSSATADGPTAQELRTERLAANRQKPYSAPYQAPDEPFLFRTVRVDDPDLVPQLDAQDVDYEGVRPGILSELLFSWILPIGIMIALWLFIIRRFGPGQGVMSFGRNKAKLIADRDTGVHFTDVAGVPEAKADLEEVVEFLKDHERFTRLGAAIPKGVLLVGPPGTGKTLLARAVAGEAGVPFFAMSGSDFVEMFVGVGASRVRDLFEQAKRNAPCIVFIDELDAIGRARAAGTQPGNDEREQTLNQLLVEMDGFEANTNVIILAATNRPENLDRALQRPGRFDRQVLVDLPDLDGRKAILQVHARGKPLADDADLHRIAQATAGMAGADLANVINEGCLLAARRRADRVYHQDLMEAVEKVVAGPERRSRRLDAAVRRRVAYHEVGHALVAALGSGGEPVNKISIIPRGRAALGYTLQVPEEDRFLHTRGELEERILTLLGGRAAEELVFGDVSTGAENDLEKASAMARQMVAMFGMSERNGLLHCQRRSNDFLQGMMQRECSETTATMIDEESRAILTQAYETASERLRSNQPRLERIATRLLEQETIERAEFEALLDADGKPAEAGD